jgi:hypothetical protein
MALLPAESGNGGAVMNTPIVLYEPFLPVADLERTVEALEARAFELLRENEVLRKSETDLCELLADQAGVIARLEQELARTKNRPGTYSLRLQETSRAGERYMVQEGR